MDITRRAQTSPITLPLPLFAAVPIADAQSGESRFTITAGLDEAAVGEFKRRSCDTTDEELMRFTSDYKRMCEGSYEAWYAKERYPFVLVDSVGILAGIVWFGPKPFPEFAKGEPPAYEGAWHTFAIRMYHPYRGRKLAYPFASFVITACRELLPEKHPIWLEAVLENKGAIRLYQKLGFTECGHTKDGEDDCVVMVMP